MRSGKPWGQALERHSLVGVYHGGLGEAIVV